MVVQLGINRKVLWLYVTCSNNPPDNIAASYLDAVGEHGGCPLELYTDLGTENGIMAGIHSFLTAASKGEIALSKLTVAVKKEIEIAVSKLKLP